MLEATVVVIWHYTIEMNCSVRHQVSVLAKPVLVTGSQLRSLLPKIIQLFKKFTCLLLIFSKYESSIKVLYGFVSLCIKVQTILMPV